MKIEFSSQRREMHLFLTINMAAMTSHANQQLSMHHSTQFILNVCVKKHAIIDVWGYPMGYSEFQVTGMIEWGQKSKPKKISRASNKTQKIPRTKI